MRDPVTKLVIVDGSSLEPELCKTFSEIFMVPNQLAVVHYVSIVTKKSGSFFSGGNERRVLLVSDQCLYVCKEDGERRRCVRIRDISEIVYFSDSFIGMRIPTEYDLVIRLASAAEIEYFLNILQVIQAVCYGKHLKVIGYKGSFKGSVMNLKRPDNYAPFVVPLTFLASPPPDADETLEELLRPPPPPIPDENAKPAQSTLSNEAAFVLQHPLLDPATVTPTSIPLTRKIETVEAEADKAEDALGAQLRRLAAINEELIQRDIALSARESTQQSAAIPPYRNTTDLSQILPAADARSASQPHMSSIALQVDPPSPRIATRTPHLDSGDERKAHESEAPRTRSAAPAHSVPALTSDSDMHPLPRGRLSATTERTEAADSDPFVHMKRNTPPPAIGHRPVSTPLPYRRPTTSFTRRGPSVTEFESSISSRTLKERLVLRQYQIDETRREIQRLFNDESSYDAAGVALLQEDLVLLVKALESDLAEVESQRSSRTQSPGPSASAPPKLLTAPPPVPQISLPTASVIEDNTDRWEWTPRRTAQYWAWVASFYQPQQQPPPSFGPDNVPPTQWPQDTFHQVVKQHGTPRGSREMPEAGTVKYGHRRSAPTTLSRRR